MAKQKRKFKDKWGVGGGGNAKVIMSHLKMKVATTQIAGVSVTETYTAEMSES